MVKVMAQGTFDILHPGHLHYLRKSKELGDKLVVVIARDSRVKEKKGLYFNEEERKKMVEALNPVDEAVLGSKGDIYSTVKQINPEIITLGYDQNHEEEKVEKMAKKATGHEVNVKRISGLKEYSSSNIRSS
ncbi:MAG: FAD synthase [Nanohaloarchaea archaeon SW_7_46_7]|nr:MAG: FAD synthase [Nanohaloarchaea archaeon SW_7_46_7]